MNCYDSAEYLAEAIDSVYAQTSSDWEIIFFDNCSTDDSAAIAKRYDARLRYFRGKEMVPLGCARNLAMAQARGKYIAFLDCDDVWLAHKLAQQLEAFKAVPGAGAVYSDAVFFSEKGISSRLFTRRKPAQGMIFRSMLACYQMPMSTTIFRRDILSRIGGGFDERFCMVEDADFFLRIAYYFPVSYVDEALAKRRMHLKSWTLMKKELFPVEEEQMLSKFAGLWPSFQNEFKDEILFRRRVIAYQYAMVDWQRGDGRAARARLAGVWREDKKKIIPFLFSYFPYPVYKLFKRFFKSLLIPFNGGFDDQAF
ncbi:MAG: glycosyltransferase [Candidatus Omnitrophota bacterium]